jgi:hypothetical protein
MPNPNNIPNIRLSMSNRRSPRLLNSKTNESLRPKAVFFLLFLFHASQRDKQSESDMIRNIARKCKLARAFAGFNLPNVPGQTAEPWTLAFLRTSNRLVCSRWFGSVVLFLAPEIFIRVVCISLRPYSFAPSLPQSATWYIDF